MGGDTNKILKDDRDAVSGPHTGTKNSWQNVDFVALLWRNCSLETVKKMVKRVPKA